MVEDHSNLLALGEWSHGSIVKGNP